MPEVIEMPKLSDTMEEGGIASWLKKEGDFVEDGEALLEIETDKATMEYLSPEEGILLKIIVQAGQTTNLNSPIALIGEKDEKYDLDQILAKYTEASSTPEKSEPTPQAEPNRLPLDPRSAGFIVVQPRSPRHQGRPVVPSRNADS